MLFTAELVMIKTFIYMRTGCTNTAFCTLHKGISHQARGWRDGRGNKPYLLPNCSFQVVSAYHSNLQFSTLKYYRIFLYSINIPNMNYAQTQSVTFSVGGRIYIQQYSGLFDGDCLETTICQASQQLCQPSLHSHSPRSILHSSILCDEADKVYLSNIKI